VSRRESATVVDLLRQRAAGGPSGSAYTFLSDGEREAESWSYADLDQRARAVGAELARRGCRGERVLLLHPAGLEFLAGFFGCLYAGAVAVPAYPPRRRRSLGRVEAIFHDARPAVVLTTGAIAARVGRWISEHPELEAVPWLETDGIDLAVADGWAPPELAAEDLAFLQYTSGSTGDPKGVMVRHDSLLANQEAIHRAFGQGPESVVVSWLPLYHDMGLVGTVMQPLYSGGRCILMSPMAFLQRPMRWLQAIDRYRATTSGGPDFAYDLCVRKVRPDDAAGLDLSSWRVAFDGAEPVRAETLERFAAAFAPSGFSASAFQPCYGLAEATLLVSGERTRERPRVGSFAADELARHRAVEAAGGERHLARAERTLVGCGAVAAGQEVLVVDPEGGVPCSGSTVGEIWVAGSGVAAGYWGREEESRRTFGARLASGDGPFLRTGDLGFVVDGELFVTGRIKDLMILRGRNVYPQDVEASVGPAHPAVRLGGVVAVAVDVDGTECLVVVCEIEPRSEADPGQVAEAVRIEIGEAHEVAVHEVVAVPAGSIPRTSSGKLRRSACRDDYLAGALEVLGSSRGGGDDGAPELRPPIPGDLDALPEAERLERVEAYLEETAARILRIDPERFAAAGPRDDLGLDSLQAVELRNRIEGDLGVDLPLTALLEEAGLRSLARRLIEVAGRADDPPSGRSSERESRRARAVRPANGSVEGGGPLSYGQRSLWFLQQLFPDSPASNLAFAARIRSGLDTAALERTIDRLVERHPVLRTTFAAVRGEPEQRVAPAMAGTLEVVAAADWSEDRRRRWLAERALRPFDLCTETPFRAALLEATPGEHLLLVVIHHVAVDFWSFVVLADELDRLLQAERTGRRLELPSPATSADYAAWQQALLQGEEGERLWSFWRDRMGDDPPVLELPRDRPRRHGSWAGGAFALHLDRPLIARLEALARAGGTTLYTVLLAAFQVLLHRYSGQGTVITASPAAGRSQPWMEGVVGYLMNPLPLRVELGDDPAFDAHLEHSRRTVLEALDHQDYPSHLLAERLPGMREVGGEGHFQVMFVFNRAHRLGGRGVGRFALDHQGVVASLGGMELESVIPAPRPALFDLQVMAVAEGESVSVSWQYARELFDAATIARMAGHWQTLLAGLVRDPGRTVSRLPLMAAAECAQILTEWSGAATPPASTVPVHRQVADRARERPEAVALVAGSESLTYWELRRRSVVLAGRLRRRGVGPESVVGIHLERGVDLVVCLLGALEAGAAYLPLDPALPDERLATMVGNSGVRVVLTRSERPPFLGASEAETLAPPGPDGEDLSEAGRQAPSDPDHPAYLIYTSGSTGQPRGVCVRHGSLAAYVGAVTQRYEIGSGDRLLQFSALSFDVSAEEIFAALTRGAALVLRDEATVRTPGALFERCRRWRVSILSLPTAYWHEVVAALESDGVPPWPEAVRVVTIGGERALPERLEEWRRRVPGTVRLINGYGPTEATIAATMIDVAGPRAASWTGTELPLGRPLPGVRAAVLDRSLQPVPIGVVGELHLAGVGLARGYRGLAAATAECFVPDPLATAPGERLYRTGDLVSVRHDGSLRFIGRRDEQIKVRGFRVELGEVESRLIRHPGLADVAAAVHREGHHARLVAYVVAAGDVAGEAGSSPSIEALRRFLGLELPEHAIPTAFVFLETLPRLASGKVDRRALPKPEPTRDALENEYVEPRGTVEEMVAAVASQVLGVDRIGARDDFFAIGCHSLLATQIVARLQESLQVELPVVELFEAPTVAGLAERIEAVRGAVDLPPIRRADRDVDIPLSFSQERLWFLNQLNPASSSYHVPRAIRLRGRLPLAVMKATWGEVVRRHEILRTRFPTRGGRPVQEIGVPRAVPLPVVDLARLGAAAAAVRARRLIHREGRRPFDLEHGPLLRLLLFRLGPEDHVLLLTEHHLVHDGWTEGVLLRDFQVIYSAFSEGRPSPLPELPIQYADFACWQREWLTGEVLEEQLAYWRAHLDGAPELLDLPADRPRPAVQSYRGAADELTIPGPLAGALRELGRKRGTTLFMTFLAVFETLLWRITHRDDFVVGTGVANRRRQETEGLLGMVINTLALRTRIDGEPVFHELLAAVREVCLGAYAHQDLPFEKVVEALRPSRSLAYAPVFQVVFAFHDAPHPDLDLPGLELESLEAHNRSTKFDLLLRAMPRAEQRAGTGPREDASAILFAVEYNTDLFDRTTVLRLCHQFQSLLAAAVADPGRRLGELAMLDDAERAQVVHAWNDQRARFVPEGSLVRLFTGAAGARPDRIAVVCGTDVLSYGGLAHRVSRLAGRLRRKGIGEGSFVGLLAERSVEMVVAVLGVLSTGAAYVPLDPSSPERRLAFMLRDSGASVVVTQEHLAARCAASGFETLTLGGEAADGAAAVGAPGGFAAPMESAGDPHPLAVAYVLYTSGTTGEPKGVMIPHGAVANYAHALRGRLSEDRGENGADATEPLRVSLNARVAFDASVKQLSHLAWGHCLEVVPEEVRLDPEAMTAFTRRRLDVLDCSPSQLKQLLEAGLDRAEARPSTVLVGGEAIEQKLWARIRSQEGTRFFNHYGPTECTVNTTVCRIEGPRPKLGRPIGNVRVHVVDPRLRPVPPGVPGELAIGGAGLAHGYLGRPGGTAQAFVPDPFGGEPGARLYRSGDLGRALADGELEFVGRIDHQVKVRGFRIEPGEIEALLDRHPTIRESAVVVYDGADGDRRLVAYAVPRSPYPDAGSAESSPVDPAAVRRSLQQALPDYMVPSDLILLDAFPLNANGKVDRHALPAPDRSRTNLGDGYVAPGTETESLMADLWAKVLELDRVGVHDDFFDLGGHSLLATRLVSRIRTSFRVDLPLAALFESPTVAQLARRVDDLVLVGAEAEEMERLLGELEGLSDEEALARLGEGAPSAATTQAARRQSDE